MGRIDCDKQLAGYRSLAMNMLLQAALDAKQGDEGAARFLFSDDAQALAEDCGYEINLQTMRQYAEQIMTKGVEKMSDQDLTQQLANLPPEKREAILRKYADFRDELESASEGSQAALMERYHAELRAHRGEGRQVGQAIREKYRALGLQV